MKENNFLPKSIEERVIQIINRENLISTIEEEGVMQGIILMALAEEAELLDKILSCQEFQNAAKKYTMVKVYNSLNPLSHTQNI